MKTAQSGLAGYASILYFLEHLPLNEPLILFLLLVNVLPTAGYAMVAGVIADRRVILAGYRLANLLRGL